ncbi:MAG: hypothetical protein O2782_15440, partial [bacterium]|nr:hypothetical protein [bacterium]
ITATSKTTCPLQSLKQRFVQQAPLMPYLEWSFGKVVRVPQNGYGDLPEEVLGMADLVVVEMAERYL